MSANQSLLRPLGYFCCDVESDGLGVAGGVVAGGSAGTAFFLFARGRCNARFISSTWGVTTCPRSVVT